VHVFNERDRQLSDLIAQPAAAMIESRTQQENLTKLNDVLAHRTTELESSQEKLARKAADLAEQDRHRDDFLAALGHELRNPLAAILSSIGVLNVPDARSEKALGILRRQVRNITRLVNDLLDTTRVKHGRLRLQCAAVDLNQAAAIALETVRMQANAKQIVLKSDLPKTPVIVSADPDRLAQILDNLLRNAVTYTDNGEVSVKVRQQDNFACVTIRDSGVGIDADDAPFVFGQYEQRDHGRRSAGLGLGLTLVKSLVEGHGGKISFRSDGANKGSEFWFTLPLVAAPAESSAYSVPVLNSQRRILVVDDQNDVADIFKVMLEGLGQTVVVAYDGATALTLARATHPQVALLDMSMGGMSGIELAQNLRREFPRERLVLIAMSGRGDIEPQARKAGVDHFFLKPVAPEELAAFLNGLGNGKD
jgi:signal transduction histidine kinase/CheY-like chemotaxis protein